MKLFILVFIPVLFISLFLFLPVYVQHFVAAVVVFKVLYK